MWSGSLFPASSLARRRLPCSRRPGARPLWRRSLSWPEPAVRIRTVGHALSPDSREREGPTYLERDADVDPEVFTRAGKGIESPPADSGRKGSTPAARGPLRRQLRPESTGPRLAHHLHP